MSVVQLLIPQQYFIKDPNSSELGKKIVSQAIETLDELGFEDFTFKKLALRIDSTEASIYRYFENKLKLLVYLNTLYWRWIDYLIDIRTYSLNDPTNKLREVLRILTDKEELTKLVETAGLDFGKLRSVVMTESDKTYLTKQVDEINKEGLFRGYKDLCHKIALIVEEVNPKYPYAHAIVSTLLEASHQQAFFAMHLPSLTEISETKGDLDEQINLFLEETLLKLLS